MDEHKLCADCPDVDDLALRTARAIDPEVLRQHDAVLVIVVANAVETVVKASVNLPREKVPGILRIAAEIARDERDSARSS